MHKMYIVLCADHVIVDCAKKTKLTVALDGEIIEMKPPLNFTVEKNALNIMVPECYYICLIYTLGQKKRVFRGNKRFLYSATA